MTLSLALQLLYDSFVLAISAYAFFRGSADEKAGALLVLACSAATSLVTAPAAFDWGRDYYEVMLIDLALFSGLGVLATFSKRFWPLWAAAFQMIDIATYLLVPIEPQRAIKAFTLLQGFWAYPILIAIAIGTRSNRRLT